MQKNSVDPRRIQILNTASSFSPGPVVYWMSRDQRVSDNWALLYAQELANQTHESLAVIFNLVPEFLGATWRQYSFMLEGLREVEEELKAKNIPFYLLLGDPCQTIPKFIEDYSIGSLVTDFSPLRINRDWKETTAKSLTVPFYEVDTHNIVPCWNASPKQEFAARTFRPKIHRLLPSFLTNFPEVKKQTITWPYKIVPTDWEKLPKKLRIDFSIKSINWTQSGEKTAHSRLKDFLENNLADYANNRNNPTLDGQSNLSPYLHFGQLSAQRIALETKKLKIKEIDKENFLEELIVRRELSDNFCFYNKNYDTFAGFPEWAKKTLNSHRKDHHEFIYSLKELETGQTHDEIWNAAQMEMVKKGKMHGYMRMYWAKKILEWTKNPEEAMKTAIYLNDTYELDGRDPNGYTGIAWSIGGVHDRPWFNKPIFGMVRYMNANGISKKFDTQKYIEQIKNLP